MLVWKFLGVTIFEVSYLNKRLQTSKLHVYRWTESGNR